MTRSLWLLLISAGLMLSISVGIRQAMGLFLTPMTLDLGVGREVYAFSMGMMNLLWGAGAPFAGAIADKFGARPVALLGGVFYAAGLSVMALSGSGTELILGGSLLGLGLSGSGFTVVLGTVGRLVPEDRRSQALGIASVGGSIGQFLALPYTHSLIDGLGWVVALIVLAVTALLIVPLAAGLKGAAATASSDNEGNISLALQRAFSVPGFWLLIMGFFVCGFHLSFVAVHLPAFLADQGFEPWLATTALTLVGMANMVGVYGCGLLGGRYPKNLVLSALYLCRSLIFLLFVLLPVTESSVLVFSVAIGLLWLGTVPLTSGLVGQIFGTRYLSMLFGFVFLGHQVGGFLGAWLSGKAFDAYGSYDLIWWLSIILGLVSAALHWPIRERPVKGVFAPT